MARERFIGVDWGSTNLRAFLFDDQGTVVEVRESPQGSSSLRSSEFEAVLARHLDGWLLDGPFTDILICGMAGSRHGWCEVPYVPCPCTIGDAAGHVTNVRSSLGQVRIVPGLHALGSDGLHDVMRGEETQVWGARGSSEFSMAVAPGTHSKWVRMDGDGIESFRTFMTGELFSVLRTHSVLGQLMHGANYDRGAFSEGVSRSAECGDLTSLLFSVRTEPLFDRLAPEAVASYLSGLLIGAEIASARRAEGGAFSMRLGDVVIIGASDLSDRYVEGLRLLGIENVRKVDSGMAAAKGLWNISLCLSARQLA